MMTPDLQTQIKVSRMLGVAFALTLLGVGGLGSLVALILGYRALKIVRASDYQLTGRVLAWRCIIVGALGTALWPALILRNLFNFNISGSQ